MRLAVIVAMLFWTAQFSGMAAADLYRWVDPESGSVKFSSYPPPWYGDDAKQRRAPKVEVIPVRSAPPAMETKAEAVPKPAAVRAPEGARPPEAERDPSLPPRPERPVRER